MLPFLLRIYYQISSCCTTRVHNYSVAGPRPSPYNLCTNLYFAIYVVWSVSFAYGSLHRLHYPSLNQTIITFFDSNLPPGYHLRHVRELSEIPDDSPTSEAQSAGKSLPPMLISEGLPPVPAKLVKKYRREYLLKWPSC